MHLAEQSAPERELIIASLQTQRHTARTTDLNADARLFSPLTGSTQHTARTTDLDLTHAAEQLTTQGHQVEVSSDAGRFLCNVSFASYVLCFSDTDCLLVPCELCVFRLVLYCELLRGSVSFACDATT